MIPLAPRYDARILEAVRALDDRDEPIAEVARRVCAAAERFGLIRPSYVHIRRLVLIERDRQDAERARRDAIRAIVADVAGDLVQGRLVDAYEVEGRVRQAGR